MKATTSIVDTKQTNEYATKPALVQGAVFGILFAAWYIMQLHV